MGACPSPRSRISESEDYSHFGLQCGVRRKRCAVRRSKALCFRCVAWRSHGVFHRQLCISASPCPIKKGRGGVVMGRDACQLRRWAVVLPYSAVRFSRYCVAAAVKLLTEVSALALSAKYDEMADRVSQ